MGRIKTRILRIIVKLMNQEANLSDLEQLEGWLKVGNNRSLFKKIAKTHYISLQSLNYYDVDKAKVAISQRIKIEKAKDNRIYYGIAAFAASVVIVGFIYFGMDKIENNQDSIVQKVEISGGSDRAVLTLENGDQIQLEKGSNYESDRAKSDGESLTYDQKSNVTKQELVYNFMTVPRGGQFIVELSDGTKVWLNSATQLKFPVNFIEGRPREVEVVYGEAYFEVSPSEKHDSSQFRVITNKQRITVLGTHFNIKAYPDDDAIATTLVEGKVEIQHAGQTNVLKPDQQSLIPFNSDNIIIKNVDAAQAVGWINGLYIFDDATLEEIMKTLSRWYDIEVVFEKAEIRNIVFTGVLERTRSIQTLLQIISESTNGEMKFDINNKTLKIM